MPLCAINAPTASFAIPGCARRFAPAGPDGDKALAADPNAVGFVMDAKRHCKAVGFSKIPTLAKKAEPAEGPGILDLTAKTAVRSFIAAARTSRFWDREAEK